MSKSEEGKTGQIFDSACASIDRFYTRCRARFHSGDPIVMFFHVVGRWTEVEMRNAGLQLIADPRPIIAHQPWV
jgi:hypothetical protein